MNKREKSEESEELRGEAKTPRQDRLSARLSRRIFESHVKSKSRSHLNFNPAKSNRILIEDTPTPLLTRKYASIIDELVDVAKSPSASRPQIPKAQKIIPNTPAFGLLNNRKNDSKKPKKLLDVNGLMDEESLPGDKSGEDEARIEKISNIFKPKAKLLNNDENDGCDLSFESLQKRERKRTNPYVVRLSEVLSNLEIEKNKNEAKNVEKNSIQSSPVVVHEPHSKSEKSNKTIVAKYGEILASCLHKTSSFTSSIVSPNHCLDTRGSTTTNNSFTKVTRQINTTSECESLSSFTRYEKSEEKQLSKDKDIVEKEETRIQNDEILSDDEIDRILFDGKSAKPKTTDLISNFYQNKLKQKSSISKSLVDKTNTYSKNTCTFKKSQKSIKNSNLKSNTKIQSKKFYFHPLNLNPEQVSKLRSVNEKLSKLETNSFKPNTFISCTIDNHFKLETTHLIVDFQQAFESLSLKLKLKSILLLAALNNCKIARFEYVEHSGLKQKWLNPDKYLLDNYLTDIDDYGDDEFDVKLVKFIKNYATIKKLDLFSKLSSVYIIEERPENNFDDEENFLFTKKSSLYESLSELILKCGGHLTSRPTSAALIVAIDKTCDYDQEKNEDKIQICNDQKHFTKCLSQLKKNVRLMSGVEVVSSDWVFDSIFQNKIQDKNKYALVRIFPEIL